jgi:HTH-type transcriptional regulator, sugar sensing transcriptional regulator
MQTDLHTTLIEFGLSDKEARMYLSLLSVASATVSDAAEKAGVNRSSAYVVLSSLLKKGFVGFTDDAKVRHYVPTPPDALLRRADRTAKNYTKIRDRIATVLPQLRSLSEEHAARPKVRVHQGTDGLLFALNETLRSKEKTMRVVSDFRGMLPREDLEQYLKKRRRKGIKKYGIHPASPFAESLLKDDTNGIDETVFISKDQLAAGIDIAIHDNKITYMSPEHDGVAVIIEDRAMAQAMKGIFDMAWQEAKRMAKKKKPDQ